MRWICFIDSQATSMHYGTTQDQLLTISVESMYGLPGGTLTLSPSSSSFSKMVYQPSVHAPTTASAADSRRYRSAAPHLIPHLQLLVANNAQTCVGHAPQLLSKQPQLLH